MLTNKLSRVQRILRIVFTIPILALIFGPIIFTPIGYGLIPCAFRDWTGLSCPGCGMTRSFHSASALHFKDAFDYHLLGPFFLIAMIFFTVRLIYEIISGKRIKSIISEKKGKSIVLFVAVILFGFWIYRMIIESGIIS